MQSKHGVPFAVPVSEDLVPGYGTIIQQPMDLGTISQNLKQRSYNSLGEPPGLQQPTAPDQAAPAIVSHTY